MSAGGRAIGGPAGVLALTALLAAGAPPRVAAQCPDGSLPPCRAARPALDTARYVILPFVHREGSGSSLLDGADCAEYLSESFGRWSDVRLADRTRIYDALERRGARAPFRIGFGTGLAIARELGAGRLVMGQLWSAADTLRLTVGVYDAARGGPPLREAKARMAANSTRAGTAFDALADSLLAADPGAFSGAGTEQTHSIAALRAYTQGARAIRTWDLASATQHLRAAIAADSDFARAYASLGQVLLWAADSTPQAMRDRAAIARRTGGLLEQLGTTERPLLLAQQAMFERRWPDACARYREVLQRDSANFDAWYGLAQCNAEDPVVIRDPADTMRFVFRGSWHTAVLAYTKALLLAPSFNFVFGTRARQRLAQLLLAEEFWWRRGRLDTLPYFAFPEIEADSLAFHPISGATIARGTRPTTHTLALARNRQSLVDVTAAWAGAFPQDPGAHRAFAYALEVSGRIAPVVGELHSALAEIAAAQRIERQPSERLRDAVAALRLLVKAEQFGAARRAGDSLLRAVRAPTPGVAGVAVLLGRPALATRLLAVEDTFWLHSSADNEPVRLPLKAGLAGLQLLVYAAVAAPRESIQVLEGRVEELLGTLAPAARAAARSALLDLPAELVFDEMGLRPAHRSTPPGPDATMAMQWALAHDDTAFVRANLEPRAGASPEYAFLWARAALALGDSMTAERVLDGVLGDLTGLYSALFDYVPLAGCLVRVMVLRAELAAARRETAAARQWASAVIDLWSGAEPALQPAVQRMRRIAAPTR